MSERLRLVVGEERAVHLPPLPSGSWRHEVTGMTSAVSVRKLWPADPYPEEDEDEEHARERAEPDVVFMVRGTNPGAATVRFVPAEGSGRESRAVEVTVEL